MDTSLILKSLLFLPLGLSAQAALAGTYNVPGRVEAENFTSFSGSASGKGGSGTYSNLEPSSEGTQDVGWIASGEIFGYDINATSAGSYSVVVRAASAGSGSFHVSIDSGAFTSSAISVSTGGWQNWQSYTIAGISLSAGSHSFTIVADVGGFNLDYSDFSVSSGATPSIPGKVEAESYVSFSGSTSSKGGSGPDRNLEACSEGTQDVGWNAAGDVFGYDVNATVSGSYDVAVRAAAPSSGSFHLVVDNGVLTTSPKTVSTGGWQSWTDVVFSGVQLSSGRHNIKLVADSAGFNLNYLRFDSGSPAVAVPGRIEAERFISFSGNSSGKGGSGPYSNLEPSSEGTQDVGWISDGEVFGYDISVASAGTFTANVRVASALSGRFHLLIDNGAFASGSYDVSTGGWQGWQTVAIPGISLGAGAHNLKVVAEVGGFNFDYIDIAAGTTQTGGAKIYLTTPDQSSLLAAQPPAAFAAATSNPLTISVNPGVKYQQMEGFGASLTDSSAWLIANRMNASQRSALMSKLFDRASGIGVSFLRLPMGASDFALGNYSYDDMPAGQSDPSLARFSIAHDQAYIIPVLAQARSINPSIKVLATPWSAPAWMKDNQSFTGGGTLIDPGSYPAYAQYFVKFIQAYQSAGIPIFAVAPQNEPLYAAPYAGMTLQWWQEFNFVRYHLGPAFQSAGLSTKILIFDHNWSDESYPQTLMANDPAVLPYIAGTAFHCYGGDPSAMGTLHNAFPNKDIYFTECSGGTWGNFAGDLKWTAENLLIKGVRNWAKTVLRWNLALDENHGPFTPNGCSNCDGMVTINSGTGAVTLMNDYYTIGHASKFVQPGAYRIDSNTFGGGSIEDVAFQNPDGSKVLLVLNSGAASSTFQVKEGAKSFSYTIPAGALATLVWN